MAKRNRPGRRERQREAKAERMALVEANLSRPKVERPMYGAPKGLGNSTLARKVLQSHSHDIGFVGPRGYHTPKDLVSKREKEPGMMAPRFTTQRDREEARKLAASITATRPA